MPLLVRAEPADFKARRRSPASRASASKPSTTRSAAEPPVSAATPSWTPGTTSSTAATSSGTSHTSPTSATGFATDAPPHRRPPDHHEGVVMPKTCDNASVGVIITNDAGEFLMFERATFPPGIAPVAGHVDNHGTLRQAAEAEVREEVGLSVVSLSEITTGWRNNRCRRTPGPRGTGHQWTIFRAVVTGDLAPSQRETRNARWIPAAQMQALADRTSAYAFGFVTDSDFAANPGLEPVWAQWLDLTGAVDLSPGELQNIDLLASTSTPKES